MREYTFDEALKQKNIRQDIRWYRYAIKLGFSVNMGSDSKRLLPNGNLPVVCNEWTGFKPLISCSGDSYTFYKNGDKVIRMVHSGNLQFHWQVVDNINNLYVNKRRYFYYDL